MKDEILVSMVSKNPIVQVVNENFGLMGTIESSAFHRGPQYQGGVYSFIAHAAPLTAFPARNEVADRGPNFQRVDLRVGRWRENYGWKDEYVLIVQEKDIENLRRIKEFTKWP